MYSHKFVCCFIGCSLKNDSINRVFSDFFKSKVFVFPLIGKKRRLTFIECGCDINMMIDLAKVADLVSPWGTRGLR